MKLTNKILPEYFTIALPNNSHYLTATNTFDFVDRNSKSLVITVGDSWTWGSDLSPDNNNEFRLTHVFGNLVSTKLNADWLNLGQPGSNNFFIAEKTEEFGYIIKQLDYKNIYMVCTMTEIGRSFNSHHDEYIDYIEWFNNNHIDDFLSFLNAECVRRIKKVAKENNIKLIMGTNFIDSIGIDTEILLPDPWFRLLDISCAVKAYAGTTGTTRLQAVSEFLNNDSIYKLWMIDLIEQSKHIDRVVQSAQLIKQHPSVAGHKIWADYILEHLL